MRLKTSNIGKIVNRLTDMARRVSRVDGASDEIHQVLLDSHRELLASNPVGQNKNLGPSITEPTHPEHVFSVDSGNEITFGTSVVYAESYNKRTGRDLVIVNEDIKTKIKKAVVNYVRLNK